MEQCATFFLVEQKRVVRCGVLRQYKLMVAAVVVIAQNRLVLEVPSQKSLGHFVHGPVAAANNLNSLSREYVNGPLANVAGQHGRYTHFSQYSGNIGLAATALGRIKSAFLAQHVFVNLKYGVVVTMPKVFIYDTISGGDSDLHTNNPPQRSETD
jgi:hypothetical protein